MSGEILALVDGKEYKVKAQITDGNIIPTKTIKEDGREKIIPNRNPAELGKRFLCALELERQEIKDGKTVTETIYKSGGLKLIGGDLLEAGCGTEFLVTKASSDSSSFIECCGKPAVMQKPKPLPSSD